MLETLASEFRSTGGLHWLVIIVRVVGAALFSGVIGLERELRKDTAGLRTHMVIGIASAVFALTALELMLLSEARDDALRLDPLRLIEAVTGGVAFLAAGMVVYTRGNVKGLTTGAGMWLAASIGLACGLGYWFIALMAVIAGLLIIGLLRRMEIAAGIKQPDQDKGETADAEQEPDD